MPGARSILFFDPVCPSPYSTQTRQELALPGTEATMSRVADALAATVMQHIGAAAEGRYLPLTKLQGFEHVVVLRDLRRLQLVHDLFPDARLYLWAHDLVQPDSKHGRRLSAHAGLMRRFAV